jgi:hypothetical protein
VPFRWFCAGLLGAWLALAATGHLFSGWIHVLPLIVLLAVAARAVYALVVLD